MELGYHQTAISTPGHLPVAVRGTGSVQSVRGGLDALKKGEQRTLDARYQSHPQRFVKGCPAVSLPPVSVAINPLLTEDKDRTLADHVNFPTLTAAGYVSDKGKSILSKK